VSTGQIFVILIMFGGAFVIVQFNRFLSDKKRDAIITSLMFGFWAILLTNTILNRRVMDAIWEIHGGAWVDALPIIVFMAMWVLMSFFAILVMNKIEDAEKVRKIFFYVSLGFFAVGMVWIVVDASIGLATSTRTFLPGHACRQTSYTFPLVYYMKPSKFRRWVLTYLCFMGIIGAIATLVVPGNILDTGGVFFHWIEFDTIIAHLFLMFVPVLLLVSKQVRADWAYIPIAAAALLIQVAFAMIMNLVNSIQAPQGRYGNWLYLTEPVRPWLPTWLFLTLCYIIGVAIGVSLIMYERLKNKRQDTIGNKG